MEKDKERLNKFADVQRGDSCPNCGYCPHCGRGGHWTQPWYPWYPTYPWSRPWITWSIPSVWTTDTQNLKGDITTTTWDGTNYTYTVGGQS